MSDTGGQLSAFLDDETSAEESQLLLRRLARDESLRRAAERYLLIGQSVRGELGPSDPRRLRRALAACLADEAAGSAAGSAPAAARRWLRPVAGAAVAATVAVVAILSLQRSPVDVPGEAAVTVPVAASSVVSPVAVVPPSISRRASTAPDRLSEYYLNHAEYGRVLRGRGQLVRIVTRPAPDDGDSAAAGERRDAEADPRPAR